MKIKVFVMIITMFLTFISCNNKRDQVESLMLALDDYETAWANGDFVKVESYFTEDAKRLHTEPYVWDRQKINEYFLE